MAGQSDSTIHGTVAIGRDVVLAGIPLLYVLGFVAWSYYAFMQGLGFLPVAAPQYLMAGFLYGILVVVVVGFDYLGVHEMRKQDEKRDDAEVDSYQRKVRPRWRSIAWRGAIKAGAVAAAWVVLVILGGLAVVRVEHYVILAFVLFAIVLWLVEAGVEIRNARARRTRASSGRRTERANNEEDADPEGGEPDPFSVSLGLWPLALLIIFASSILPSVHPEFGGAMPRHAYLDLEADVLTAGMLAVLVSDAPNATGVVRSVQVTVLFEKGESLLVKPTSRDDTSQALYEIRMTAINAILWID